MVTTYFAFTTLSTVGFGDLHPMNSFERLCCVVIFIFGNGIFGFIIGEIMEMVDRIQKYNLENDDMDSLNKFFNLISKYNYHKQLDRNIKEDIERHMEYYWNNDRNYALIDKVDQDMMEQLPDEVQNRIYKNFLYVEFLSKFNRMFTIFKSQYKNSTYQKLKIKSLYTWDDEEY